MTADIKKRGLGRGLDALFQDVKREAKNTAAATAATTAVSTSSTATSLSGGAQKSLPIEKLTPGKFQPRRIFRDEAIDQLAESIAAHGILQPLLVRPLQDDTYEIIAGERRWRAAQKARLHSVPVVVQEFDDTQALEIGLIENLQREDLTPIEEAEGYARLIEEFNHTQEKLAQQLGKSRSHIANTMRLLKLPASVKSMVNNNTISAGHARAILMAKNPEALAALVAKRGLSVRQTEKLVADESAGRKTALSPKGIVQKDVDILALEQQVSSRLGLRVTIDGSGSAGKLVIEYKDLDQLDDLLERLSQTPRR